MAKINIIFDMDGTLCNTAKATVLACNESAAERGMPLFDEVTVRNAIGYACPEIFFKWLPDEKDEQKVLDFGARVEELEEGYVAGFGDKILFDGIPEMLDEISRKGIKMHIASTGSPHHVRTTLETTGISNHFESISSGEPNKIDMVKRIIASDSGSVWLMLGDMEKDAEAAKGNDIMAVGAGYGYCRKELHSLFDIVISAPSDLLRIIDDL